MNATRNTNMKQVTSHPLKPILQMLESHHCSTTSPRQVKLHRPMASFANCVKSLITQPMSVITLARPGATSVRSSVIVLTSVGMTKVKSGHKKVK